MVCMLTCFICALDVCLDGVVGEIFANCRECLGVVARPVGLSLVAPPLSMAVLVQCGGA